MEKAMFPSTDALPNYIRKALPDEKILEKLDKETEDDGLEMPVMDIHSRGFCKFSSSETEPWVSSWQAMQVRLSRFACVLFYSCM